MARDSSHHDCCAVNGRTAITATRQTTAPRNAPKTSPMRRSAPDESRRLNHARDQPLNDSAGDQRRDEDDRKRDSRTATTHLRCATAARPQAASANASASTTASAQITSDKHFAHEAAHEPHQRGNRDDTEDDVVNHGHWARTLIGRTRRRSHPFRNAFRVRAPGAWHRRVRSSGRWRRALIRPSGPSRR